MLYRTIGIVTLLTQSYGFNKPTVLQDMSWSEILGKLPLENRRYFISLPLLGSLPIKISVTTHSPAMVLLGKTMIGRNLHVQNQEQFVEPNRNILEDRHFWVSLFLLLFSSSCQDRIPETTMGFQLLWDL